MSESKNLLEVKNLKQYFDVPGGFMKTLKLKAVDDISFDIKEGETLGLVGESGCGKTTVGRTILQLYKPTARRSLVWRSANQNQTVHSRFSKVRANGVSRSLLIARPAYDSKRYHRRTFGCA